MIPSTVELCVSFPTQTQVLSGVYPLAPRTSFSGRTMVLRPRYGREALRQSIEQNGAGRVCIIDGSADRRFATLCREELACALAAKVKAIVVLGPVSDAVLIRAAPIAIFAMGITPLQLPGEGGDVALGAIQTDAGILTDQQIVIADEDGVVAIESAVFQQRYPINRPNK